MGSNIVWSTESINENIQKIRKSIPTVYDCFYERDTELKNSNILFQLTKEEEDEFIKCSSDVSYFVETYCRFLTDKGRTLVDLRDYQSEILNILGKEEWNNDIEDFVPTTRSFITMQSRQSGKCLIYSTLVKIKNILTNKIEEITIGDLYEIMSYKKNKTKTKLYKLSEHKGLHKISLYLINLLENLEYRKLNLDEDNITKKILSSIPLAYLEIETDDGYKPITEIHKTQPYTVWNLQLENGYKLECADNHIVFDKFFNQRFVKDLKIGDYIITDNGDQKVINLYKSSYKISMYDITVNSKEHRYYSNGILSHNTTTISAFFAWYLCFHNDRNLAILANKDATTMEIIAKVTDVFKGLPFFLKPGITSIDKHSMRLDNGCMLTSQATTKTAQIGYTIHVLYIDEFAHIQQNIAREFWRSVYPTLSSSLVSQCIISSTPYGQDNLFFEIWDKSIKGQNSFVNKRVDYWQVPGHDDEWAAKMKRDFGEDEFAQEFELKFDIKTNNLLEGSNLKFMHRLSKKYPYEYKELNKTKLDSELYQKLFWRKDFDPNKDIDKKTDRFVLTLDIAEGKDINEKKDSDYNIANIFQLRLKSLAKLRKLRKDEHNIINMFRLEQVGLYRDNVNDETILGKVTKALIFDQFDSDVCKLLIEMNFNGKSCLNNITDHSNYDDCVIVNTYHTAPIPGEQPPRKKAGFKTRSDKEHFVKLGKRLINERTIIVTEEETSHEFNAFGKGKDGKYKGIARHDDTVMTTINLGRLYEENEYEDWLYDFLEEMPDSKQKRYVMELIKEPYEPNDMNDDTFSLYDINEFDTENNIMNIFNNEAKSLQNRYGKRY